MLFNLAASHSQSAAGESRSTRDSLNRAVQHYQSAAGIFQYILENFRNAPSADMSVPSLKMLVSLMLAQGQECLLHQHMQKHSAPTLKSAECAAVAELYAETYQALSSNVLREYVPPLWIHMAHVKQLLYESMADRATGLEQLEDVHLGSQNADAATWTGRDIVR